MDAEPFEIRRGGTLLRGDVVGEGTPVVVAHGLTATRAYVLLGSRTLERSGHRVVRYDARGHGSSGPAASGLYDYGELAADLTSVMDDSGIERAVLVGSSMGTHTAARVALTAPDRVAALALVAPAYDPDAAPDLAEWDRLARGLRDGGAAGFVAAYDLAALPERWRGTVQRVLRTADRGARASRRRRRRAGTGAPLATLRALAGPCGDLRARARRRHA